MAVSITTTGAAITYTLYLLPDTVNPVTETSADFFNNLQSGDYSVVANQFLNNETNTQQQFITINNLLSQLDFDVSHTINTACDTDGTIVVNVISGNAVWFEIISGPEIISPQTSNIFENLGPGAYVIRVFDDCDNAVSKTYTMLLNTNNTSMTGVSLPNVFNTCDEAVITNNVLAFSGSSVIYPLVVTYTVMPPDGSANMIFTQNIASGASQGLEISQSIPLFGEEIFFVNMQVTDSCGNSIEFNQPLDPSPIVNLVSMPSLCGQYFNLSVTNYLPPYSLSFASNPIAFDPLFFNENYPGPYNDSAVSFGDDESALPIGSYIINLIDSCGRTGTALIEVVEEQVDPLILTSNSGCSSTTGFLEIGLPDREIITATIISAPSTYTEVLPNSVNSYIDNGILTIQENITPGDYILNIIDNCGFIYTIEATVPDFQFQELNAFTKPDCETATGSVNIESNHGNLTSITIITAPQTFMETLPFNANSNIDSAGIFFINDLPIGNYIFESMDECNFQYNTSVDVISYSSTPEAYLLSRNCGSFDVSINDMDETVTNKAYWMQMFFPDTNTWGHPNTGVAYTEGQIPTTTTAIQIENFETLFNIFLIGDFRLIKVFQSFNSSNPEAFCLDIFANFTVFSDLVISGAYNLDCIGNTDVSDVIIDVIGVAPYNFSIIAPIVLDNGTSNIFLDLAPGIYEIRVEDACGSIENTVINSENLLPLARANMPESLSVCRDDLIEEQVFLLTSQEEQILGNQNPNNYHVSYHLSQMDADTGNNPLPDEYSNTSNPQTIFARVSHNNLILCHATTSFIVFVGQEPQLNQEEIRYICLGDTLTLAADAGFDFYEWSTGETTQSITISEVGIYDVLVGNGYLDFSCENTKQFIVNGSEPALINSVTISDWTASQNTIAVLISGAGDYLFSIDNINFQEDHTFTNLTPGEYTVYVKDNKGCGTVSKDVFLLNYPRFFTPNGDDENEVWQIKFSNLEPELKVVIFDRYGKLIAQFGSQDIGWDGTYNGFKMPTSDYWFYVTRANNVKYKGHFTLKR
ncbi:T9SS type B sorting domain-containing protein [Lacinutrix jangbogonensis]|uniref:T9SS type B sorting domain-containing protein n=1 Tax=Lacinutrix jangbogonensis TaxID=1469557 RepID=UPI000A478D0F|nr:T9SS type B sorting domain-containing protein [Lacinutrix jangbogonensis]